MIFSLFRRGARPDTISTLYGMIVAQARLPCFYRDYAVADTVNGRFDLIVLHLALVLERLAQDPALQSLGQGVFDRFCQDMDHNLREMGIGDLKVPREMRRIGEAFYGRAQAYRAALASHDNGLLVAALARNIYGGTPAASRAAPRLAAYIREALRDLAAQDRASLAGGALRLPDPAKIPAPHDKSLIAMKKTGNPWSVPVTVEDIPDTGLHIEIEAPAATRTAVAELAALRELPRLSAVFDLTRQGAAVHVRGQVSGRVGQTCVVTLEPIESAVEEAIDLKFAPAPAGETGIEPGSARKQARPDDEAPEPLVDGTLDLGALAIEFLILGINPYPRKAGAQFAPPAVEAAGEHPFAALAALKKRLGGGQP